MRVTLASADEEDEREKTLHKFERAHRKAIHEFREDLSEEAAGGTQAGVPDGGRAPRTDDRAGRAGPAARGPGGRRRGGDLTPVMARLAPADLETLDTLITAGIAPNRAEAVRWALARIRERPAYEQIVGQDAGDRGTEGAILSQRSPG